MSQFLKWQFFGKRDGSNAVTPVGVHPSGGLRVFLEGLRSTVQFTISSVGALPNLVISSLPNLIVSTLPHLIVSTLPNLVVSTMPKMTVDTTLPVLLAQSLLGATDTLVYTADADYQDVSIYVTNLDIAEVTCQISMGALDDAHSLVKDYPLPLGDRYPIFLPSLANGTVIRGLCSSASKVNIQIWGTNP